MAETRPLPPACIKCGGDEDLMNRAMAPGMTCCRPCRVQMAEQPPRLCRTPVQEAFLTGFRISGEGWNGEWPFEGASDDAVWERLSDHYEAWAEQHEEERPDV